MAIKDGTKAVKEVPGEIRATLDNLHVGAIAKADPSAQMSKGSTSTMGTNSSATPGGVLFVKDATGRLITESQVMPGDISLLTGKMCKSDIYLTLMSISLQTKKEYIISSASLYSISFYRSVGELGCVFVCLFFWVIRRTKRPQVVHRQTEALLLS